jgi:hypothetical protein
MSLAARLDRIEKSLNLDGPRVIRVYWGEGLSENWTERAGDGAMAMYVPCGTDEDPFDFLSDAQRRLIRPGDVVTTFEASDDCRDAHLQLDRPPWKRRPWRPTESGEPEVQDEWGCWREVGRESA